MKYNIKENVNSSDFIAHLTLHLMGPLFAGKSPAPFDASNGELEIKVFLNGLEVDVEQYFKFVDREIERLIGVRARELVDEEVGAVENILHRIKQVAREELSKKFPLALGDEYDD